MMGRKKSDNAPMWTPGPGSGPWTTPLWIPGTGAGDWAGKLVWAVAEMAREAGVKIIPQCSYARVQFDRKPEYADVYEKE